MNKKVIWAVNIILFITLIFSVGIYKYSVKYMNTNDNLISLDSSSFKNGESTLNYRKLTREEFGIYSYKAIFKKEDLRQDSDQYSVIVSKLSGQSYHVLINGIHIGAAGDYEGVDSRIWNSVFRFSFDKRILNDTNTLTLEIVGLYDIGLNDIPVIITDYNNANILYMLYSVGHSAIKSIGLGVIVFCAIIMFIFYFVFKKSPRKKTFMYIFLALVFSLVFIIDLFSIEYMPINFTLYKKINIISLYLAMLFAILGLTEYYQVPKLRIFTYLSLLVSVVASILAQDIYQFNKWIDIINLLIPINIIMIDISLIRKKPKSYLSYVNVACITFFLIGALPITLLKALGYNKSIFNNILPVFLVPICISILTIILTELNRLQFTISSENKRFRYFYNKSITDGLTGLYNYSFMLNYLDKIENPYAVFLFDIDNLKELNDNLGHLEGNNAILMITNTLKEMLPNNAVAGRFGGDEFMVVIFNEKQESIDIMEKLRKKIAATKIKNTELHVSLSIGLFYVTEKIRPEKIIEKADNAMYKAKEQGKNRLIEYSE